MILLHFNISSTLLRQKGHISTNGRLEESGDVKGLFWIWTLQESVGQILTNSRLL
jgi:hypothetical protein